MRKTRFGRHLFGKRHVKNLYCLEAYRYGLLFGGTSLGFPFPFFAGNGITPDVCVITSRVKNKVIVSSLKLSVDKIFDFHDIIL